MIKGKNGGRLIDNRYLSTESKFSHACTFKKGIVKVVAIDEWQRRKKKEKIE
ncbi:hypothetical protein Phum_PHUM265930 [Pediculus humanus corporis]|uniref:Uncharacterized protein n=1 Tax=Pediculus humanus subsp. corporis TaxID=121224 RepID=E0VKJ5_PEDHC|nr:uncharacterized protein Phum_PHUM265930 [Pediculus humanus corporis]EEB13901.1 hypothetical protein Phum_PHUM265930 [Pediculus humanus corporis]